MFNLISNSLRKRAKVMLFLLPVLLVSDQLWAKSSKLLILGDSLSAGYGLTQAQSWVSLLQDAWQKSDITVVNAAISGETTDGALARLPRLLDQHSPSHVFVELGGNDGLQGHSIAKMRSNLSKIVELSQSSGATVILQEMQIPPNYGRRYTELFTGAYTAVAHNHNVVLLPFFLADIALKSDLMQADGIHPNAKAQPIIAESMAQTLQPLVAP
ncbi:arylesterase [Paraglaciecola sp. 20A4]|uniref:GDSL-type esterase/lipase family protein n=1 Tax=Paraglaciecola sp. 20A4 TaxID=2687288 RepID=UPI00140A6D85